jgi:hypothetical protein
MMRTHYMAALAALTLLWTRPAVAVSDHLKCYKVTDPTKLEGVADIDTAQFGLEVGCRVFRTKQLCVPAEKTVVSALDKATDAPIVPLPLVGAPQPGDVLCYRLKCPTPISPLPNQEVTDQFGTRTLSRFRTVMLCTPAVKGTAYCGDGAIGSGEQCEGADLGGADCQSLGFASGTLACTPGCQLDTSGCVPNPPTSCGNGTIEAPESCDGADLGGATCTSLGFALGGSLACTGSCGYDTSSCTAQALPASGQTTCWDGTGAVVPCAGTGQDGEIQAGATLAYQDNGDGTITDLNTRLQWEKLASDGSVHDKGQPYSWADAFAVKIAALNTVPCFAGHCDWRLPNVRELQTIADYERMNPAVSAAFNTGCIPGCTVTTCSCTASSNYWSSSTYVVTPSSAWYVFFLDGNAFAFSKTFLALVRAVRGGL